MLDCNDPSEEWRKVFLYRTDADDCWTLHDDEHGNLLDEPDTGCPGAGFTTASILADVCRPRVLTNYTRGRAAAAAAAGQRWRSCCA